MAYEGKALVCGLVGKPDRRSPAKITMAEKAVKGREDIKIFVAEVRQGLFLPVRMQAKSFLGDGNGKVGDAKPDLQKALRCGITHDARIVLYPPVRGRFMEALSADSHASHRHFASQFLRKVKPDQ